MSIAETAQAALDAYQSGAHLTLLADPVSGGPSVPTGAQAIVNTLWGYLKWIGAAVAVIALGIVGITAWMNHQSGRQNEAMGRGGVVLAGIAVIAAAPGVIGVLTGT